MRDALRALRDSGVGAGARGVPLEVQPKGDQPPRLERATPLEETAVRVRAVPGEPLVGFRAFLDGIQRSQVLAHAAGVPIVHGAVAAAVRVREARRMHTWDAPRVDQALYAPHALLDAALLDSLRGRVPVVDTMQADPKSSADDPDAVAGARHPQELVARALTAVQRAREAAELALAAAWVARGGDGPLLVDGGTSGSAEAARSAQVIGVVKTHRTLYADEAALPMLLGLRQGERTTAMTLSSPRRHAVASWYLRLRDPAARSPLFGLVRVEAAITDDIRTRADLVSRWLLAERTPVSLPDQRWDVMVYGIRECEQYLTAILQ